MTDKGNTAVEIPVLSQDPKKKEKNEKKLRDSEALKLSEEDERIKNQVELLVTRACESNTALAASAVEQLIDLLRTNTGGSVASVPKPLKYIRSMYQQLLKALSDTKDASLSTRLHDVLSFVAMTIDDGRRSSLEHKLQGTRNDLASWGHAYLRYLAGSIGAEWRERSGKGQDTEDLLGFIDQIVSYMITQQDESVAIDLLLETEELNAIAKYIDSHNHRRIATYLLVMSKYLTRPSDSVVLRVVYNIYVQMGSYTEALFVALALREREMVKDLFIKCQNAPVRLQMALSCARYRYFLDFDNEEDELLSDAMGNMRLSQLYRYVAQELDSMSPKGLEEILKNDVDGMQTRIPTDNSFKLASSFASAIANCGFGKDSYLTDKNDPSVYDQTETGLIATTAMLGLIHLWDHAEGLQEIYKYFYSETVNMKAGACLAVGVAMCGVKNPFDPAFGLLAECVRGPQKEVNICSILGLGYAYAGMQKEEVKELLIPLVADSDQSLEVQCMAAFALSMVFVGSADEDLTETMVNCLMETAEDRLTETCICYLILALGCLFLCRQEAADTLLDATQSFSTLIRRYADIVVRSCAYAASGNVVVAQKFFHIIAENDDDDDDDDKAEKAKKEDKKDEKEAPTKQTPLNYKAAAVLGIGLVAMGEEIGTEMAKRAIIHVLMADAVNKGDASSSGRHAIPLVYALLSASDPNMPVVETLNRLSHDSDAATATNAMLAMGITAAGTNNARVVSKLRNLASYYQRDRFAMQFFAVRVAQGLTMMGKGLLSLSPLQNDRSLVSPTALMGLLGFLHSAMHFSKTIVGKYPYMLLTLAPSISPRMVLAVDEKMEPIKDGVQIRVGLPVDTVAVAGKPKTITGFQTQKTPVLVSVTDKVAIAPGKHKPVATVMEGIFVVEEKPAVE